jgi:hypothetical protein
MSKYGSPHHSIMLHRINLLPTTGYLTRPSEASQLDLSIPKRRRPDMSV